MDGVGIWIAFKVAVIMPLSAFYAWYLTRLMQRYRIPDKKPVVLLPGTSQAARTAAAKAANGQDTGPEGKPADAEPKPSLQGQREAKLG
jgi:intracellular septation protein